MVVNSDVPSSVPPTLLIWRRLIYHPTFRTKNRTPRSSAQGTLVDLNVPHTPPGHHEIHVSFDTEWDIKFKPSYYHQCNGICTQHD